MKSSTGLNALVLASLLSMVPAFAPMQVPVTSRGVVVENQNTSDLRKSSTSTSLSMFTGIVEEIGTVVNLEQRDDMILWDGSKGKGTELTVKGEVVMDGAYLG
jgi:hypothetical protein